MVGIIAYNAAYGNAAALSEGMKQVTDTVTYFRRKDPKGFYKQTETVSHIPDCEHYIVVGAISVGLLPSIAKKRNVCLILTDSTYLKSPAYYNRMIQINKWKVFAMPDLAGMAGTKNIYLQPFIMPDVPLIKTELICHSPYNADKERQKGTAFIAATCVKNNLPLMIIRDKSWHETIKIKASHLICVDQIYRGIGKSGLEAMLLDCAVITGEKPNCDFLPPVLWTGKKNLSNDLLSLIFDKEKLQKQVRVQRIWAGVNLQPEFVAKRIYDEIRK